MLVYIWLCLLDWKLYNIILVFFFFRMKKGSRMTQCPQRKYSSFQVKLTGKELKVVIIVVFFCKVNLSYRYIQDL